MAATNSKTAESAIGLNEKRSLTRREKALLEKIEPLIDHFHSDVSERNYRSILRYGTVIQKALGTVIWRMCMLGMRTHAEVNDPLGAEEKEEFADAMAKLCCAENEATPADIDVLWTIYYVTGDFRAVQRILNIAADESQPGMVRDLARWSTKSNVERQLIKVPKQNSKAEDDIADA